jgi:hypothetical protein
MVQLVRLFSEMVQLVQLKLEDFKNVYIFVYVYFI